MNKPKPGKMEEYDNIFLILSGQIKEKKSFFRRLFDNEANSRESLLNRFLEISIPAYETLGAPQVGLEETATDWAIQQYEYRKDKDLSLNEFIESMRGYYVIDLVPENDGIPVYIAPHYESHVFRAKFLEDCKEIIGDKIIETAFTSQLAKGAMDLGNEIMEVANDFAMQNNIMYLKDQRMPPEFDENSAESKVHILFSAAKWLKWWGERGHGYEADF
jgi:hypothetical protein